MCAGSHNFHWKMKADDIARSRLPKFAHLNFVHLAAQRTHAIGKTFCSSGYPYLFKSCSVFDTLTIAINSKNRARNHQWLST